MSITVHHACTTAFYSNVRTLQKTQDSYAIMAQQCTAAIAQHAQSQAEFEHQNIRFVHWLLLGAEANWYRLNQLMHRRYLPQSPLTQ